MLISRRSFSINIRVSFVKSMAHCVSIFQSSLPSSNSCAMSGSRKTISPKNAVLSRTVDSARKQNTNWNRILIWVIIQVVMTLTLFVTGPNKWCQHRIQAVITKSPLIENLQVFNEHAKFVANLILCWLLEMGKRNHL